ncbi:MAG: PPOX class F420-dependent oxidoreductase [Ornithinimicrobium sp.]
MAPNFATADRVSRPEMEQFIGSRHHATLVTRRRSGGLQMSPVSCGVDDQGRVVISTYPQRAKVANIRTTPEVSMVIHSDDWDGPYVQLDGVAEVIDLPEAVEPLVEYFRSISGEHPDWDEYREAMQRQGKSLIRVTIEHWGPIATGGFPPATSD